MIKEILRVVDKDLHYLETDRGYELQIMRMLKHRYSMLKVLRRTLKEMYKHMHEILRLEYIHDNPKHITKMFIHHINEVLREANQSLAMVYKELKSHEGDITDFKRMKEKLKLLHDKLEQLSADERFLYKLENTIKEF